MIKLRKNVYKSQLCPGGGKNPLFKKIKQTSSSFFKSFWQKKELFKSDLTEVWCGRGVALGQHNIVSIPVCVYAFN